MKDKTGNEIIEIEKGYGISYNLLEGFNIVRLPSQRRIKTRLSNKEVYNYLVDKKKCECWKIDCAIERINQQFRPE